MNTCEATPSAAQEIRIQSLGTPEIDSPLSRNLATAGERRVVFTVDEELVDEGAAPRPMSFELAGPRDRIYFDPSKTKCAIVTCGGLCPGINDVIRAIVMTAYNAYRVPSVLGIRYGLQGFIPSYRYDVRELAPRDVEGIHEFGGTILGTSRGPQSSSEIATALERLNISALFIIGGDGEQQEGQIWEAAMYAGSQELDNLVVLVDDNGMQIDDYTDAINAVRPLDKRWEAFGWATLCIDGHNFSDLEAALTHARTIMKRPTAIIRATVKGKGLSVAEGKLSSHNMPLSPEDVAAALQELQ